MSDLKALIDAAKGSHRPCMRNGTKALDAECDLVETLRNAAPMLDALIDAVDEAEARMLGAADALRLWGVLDARAAVERALRGTST